MADVLASLGAEVHSCHDDLEALALVLRGEAEAVCVEQTGQLPARFYRILRRRSEQQPLVILAVLPDDDPVQKSLALQAGADAALVATMAPEEVEAILESQFRVQRQRLELLREHNALSRALDCVDEGILIMNREGRVLQANRKCLSMLDLDPDVLRERSVPQLLNVLGVPRETIDRVMESEEAFLENIEVHTADGPKSVVVDCRRILDLTGSSERRWLVQFRDSSLVHTLDRLQEDFHTWAAHELRSHLSVLTAEVDALEYGDHPFDRAAMSGALRREVENLAASIEEGLESLRSGEEPTQASLDPISLLGCLEGALADVEGLALARGQRLRLVPRPDPAPPTGPSLRPGRGDRGQSRRRGSAADALHRGAGPPSAPHGLGRGPSSGAPPTLRGVPLRPEHPPRRGRRSAPRGRSDSRPLPAPAGDRDTRSRRRSLKPFASGRNGTVEDSAAGRRTLPGP
jgi:PAS domain-containing protein